MADDNTIELYEPAKSSLERPRRRLPASLVETPNIEGAPEFRVLWEMLHKRRWTVLTILLIVFGIALIWTIKQKPIYRATALLEIEKENPNIVTPNELFQVEPSSQMYDSYLQTQYRVLKSDVLAQRVIEKLALSQVAEFAPRKKNKPGPTPQTFATDVSVLEQDPVSRQKTLELFQDSLGVKPVKLSRLVEISFDSQDPLLATRVVNALASNYIEQNLEVRWDATQRASEWLSQQLVDLKGKLEKSEDKLQAYARENDLLFLESDKGSTENIVNERLRQLQDELTKAQAARYQKESLARLVQAGDAELPGTEENKLLQEVSYRLVELKREYAQLTTSFNADYPKVQQIQNQINEVQALLDRERKRTAQRLTNDYVAADKREELVRRAFQEQQKQANVIAERSVQYNILNREVQTSKHLYEGLLERLKEAGISAGLKASNIRLVDPGKPPTKPIKPRVMLNLAVSLVLGLSLGVGAAFLQERVDQTVKTSEEVESFFRVPALASIPPVTLANGNGNGNGRANPAKHTFMSFPGVKNPYSASPATGIDLITAYHRIDLKNHDHSPLAEAFRGLRTSVILSVANRPPGSLLITSTLPGEGKTTTAINLAISLAQMGRKVLIVDADMRRPAIQKIFGTQEGSQLASYLAGGPDWPGMVHNTPVQGLSAIFCGPIPPNPAELLCSERLQTLVQQATQKYDFVIFDSPPLLSVTDGRILASAMDAVILVIKGGVTPRPLVQRVQSQIRDAGGNIIGAVLNYADHTNGDNYGYYSYS
jgi:polysaccharide biosynthesis transport protein